MADTGSTPVSSISRKVSVFMARMIKSGVGWRIGWDADAPIFVGLVGSDDWSLELTAAELNDFCRLVPQLAEAIAQIMQEDAPDGTPGTQIVQHVTGNQNQVIGQMMGGTVFGNVTGNVTL